MAKKFIETRKRGFFGWITLLIFWAFNILMVTWLITAGSIISEQSAGITSNAERMGHEIGSGLGIMMILFTWAVGVVIFGALAYFTRGRKEILEVEVS